MRPPPLSHHSSPQFLLGILRLLWSLYSTKYKTSKLKAEYTLLRTPWAFVFYTWILL